MVQGELFTEESTQDQSSQIGSFFSRNQLVVGYDKLVLFGIVFLILFILTYSFGYERGHKAAERKMSSLTAHIETLVTPAPATDNQLSGQNQISQTIQVANNSTGSDQTAEVSTGSDEARIGNSSESFETDEGVRPDGKYTIQLLTVLSREGADKEISKISKKMSALKPFFIKRGRYFEICAGSFDTVANAKPVLNEFRTKKISSDAFVRPLA